MNEIAFRYIRDMLREETGIVLDESKDYLLETRLRSIQRETGAADMDELVEQLREKNDNGMRARVINALAINETHFFRDRAPFDALRDHILPQYRDHLASGKQLVIWSAACSSGQEAYSIAMTALEYFGSTAKTGVDIVASDVSEEMLQRGRDGVYTEMELKRGLSEEQRNRYFRKTGDDAFLVRDDIRGMLEFHALNLTTEWPRLPRPDIFFLRNVLIYFDTRLKKHILGKARQTLKPGGWLFLGAGETTMLLDPAFHAQPFQLANCYRLAAD